MYVHSIAMTYPFILVNCYSGKKQDALGFNMYKHSNMIYKSKLIINIF